MTKNVVVGMSGASGVVYGVRLLEILREVEEVQTHLVMSEAARRTVELELSCDIGAVLAKADYAHGFRDIAASIASGSFRSYGMVIAPCSMKTLAGIAYSYSDNLLIRAADVMLKERKNLILVPRETPFNLVQLRNMVDITEAGAIVCPAIPSYYSGVESSDELAMTVVHRILQLAGFEPDSFKWGA